MFSVFVEIHFKIANGPVAVTHVHGDLNTDALCVVNFIFIVYILNRALQNGSISGGNQHRSGKKCGAAIILFHLPQIKPKH